MTIREIADKYQLPYSLVYEATGGVQHYGSIWHNREYKEGEIIKNVKELLTRRIEKRQAYVDRASRMLSYIKYKETQ